MNGTVRVESESHFRHARCEVMVQGFKVTVEISQCNGAEPEVRIVIPVAAMGHLSWDAVGVAVASAARATHAEVEQRASAFPAGTAALLLEASAEVPPAAPKKGKGRKR